MKNNNTTYYRNLDQDDRGMHLFYMMEEIEELARYIGNEMSVENNLYPTRMNLLENVRDQLSSLSDRIRSENLQERAMKAIAYSI